MGFAIMFVGLGMICILLYRSAVYALPVIVGLEIGYLTITSGFSAIGGIAVGLVTGAVVFALGQAILSSSQSNSVRYFTLTAFVVPALLAGYGVSFALSEFAITSNLWRHIFAGVGAIAIACSAFGRLVAPIDATTMVNDNSSFR